MTEEKNKLYVGNLPYRITAEELTNLFTPFGEVTDVHIVTDKFSGRSKGFGFVTMADVESADKAVQEMNGKDVEGRSIVVNIARPKPQKFEQR